jgi:hypothetical protein
MNRDLSDPGAAVRWKFVLGAPEWKGWDIWISVAPDPRLRELAISLTAIGRPVDNEGRTVLSDEGDITTAMLRRLPLGEIRREAARQTRRLNDLERPYVGRMIRIRADSWQRGIVRAVVAVRTSTTPCSPPTTSRHSTSPDLLRSSPRGGTSALLAFETCCTKPAAEISSRAPARDARGSAHRPRIGTSRGRKRWLTLNDEQTDGTELATAGQMGASDRARSTRNAMRNDGSPVSRPRRRRGSGSTLQPERFASTRTRSHSLQRRSMSHRAR